MGTQFIRERRAHSSHPPRSARRGPDSERIRALFVSGFNRLAHRHRLAIDGSHHRWRWTLFNKLPQGSPGRPDQAGGMPCNLCGCSSMGRARPPHGLDTGSRPVIRSTSGVSLHSVAARQGVGGAGCARPMIRPRAARHHIRRDARARAQPKWIHTSPRSSAGRAAAL